MSLKLVEFQELSTSTAPFKADPQNQIEKQNILTNYTLGLSGEFLEFELENDFDCHLESVLKEAGDVLHYAVILLKVLKVKSIDESIGLKKYSKKQVKNALRETLEIIKKTYYHGHDFKHMEFCSCVKVVIDWVYDQLGEENFYIALKLNIEKLKKRYPNGFSKEDSIKRVDMEVE